MIKEHPVSWDTMLQDVAQAKEKAFLEAKRKGTASARGVSTVEEWIAAKKASSPPPAAPKEVFTNGSD